jgi:cobalt-zinc-cadmium efflux system outer membrane protein
MGGPRGLSMNCRPTGFGPFTFAGSLMAAGALLTITTPSSARATTAPPADADQAAPVGALLADAGRLVDWLRDRNADVGAAAARVTQAEGDMAQSGVRPNPSMALSMSDVTVGSTNPPGLRFADTSIYALTMSQTLEVGKRGPRMESARLRLGSERQSYFDTLAQKTAEAREALGRVAYLKSRQALLLQSRATAREVLDLQRARLDKGDLSGNDYDRLLLDTILLESELSRNESEYRAAGFACGALLGGPCEADDADFNALEASAAVAPPTDAAEALLLRRADLQALSLAARAARQETVLARRRAVPDPNLSVGYTRDYLTISGDQPRSLVFNVSLPIPAFDRGRHDAARAEAHAAELELTGRAVAARARAELASLTERRASLEATARRLREEAIPRSSSILEATVAAVDEGELSMTDLLLARRTHTELVLKAMELQWSAFSVSNELRQTLGLDAELARDAAARRGSRP